MLVLVCRPQQSQFLGLVESFARGVRVVKKNKPAHGFDNAFGGFAHLPNGNPADLTKQNSVLSKLAGRLARDSTKAFDTLSLFVLESTAAVVLQLVADRGDGLTRFKESGELQAREPLYLRFFT